MFLVSYEHRRTHESVSKIVQEESMAYISVSNDALFNCANFPGFNGCVHTFGFVCAQMFHSSECFQEASELVCDIHKRIPSHVVGEGQPEKIRAITHTTRGMSS